MYPPRWGRFYCEWVTDDENVVTHRKVCARPTAAKSLMPQHQRLPALGRHFPRSLHRRAKIDRAQDHAGRIAFQFDVAEFPRRARLDAVAQSQELLLTLGSPVRRRAFKVLH